MSPNVTTDWVPGLEGILVASLLTLLLSRVFTHCRHFTAIKSTPCSLVDCARKPGARSSVYYRALPRTVDGGSPGARGHTCKYIYTYATRDHILHDYWPRCARQLCIRSKYHILDWLGIEEAISIDIHRLCLNTIYAAPCCGMGGGTPLNEG